MNELQCLKEQLERHQVGTVLLNEPLSKHTTIKTGGPADLLVQPNDKEGLLKTIELVDASGLPRRVIGRGSNLLVKDGGIRGVVVKLGKGMDWLHIEDNMVRVGAGFSMIKLAIIVARRGLSGLEFAGGIPGTVGGAVYMNAGAHGSEIASVLDSALILFDDGELAVLDKKALQFSYRTSLLQKRRKGICLEATFKLQPGETGQISHYLAQNKAYRRETQPLQQPCCGSVFRNPKPYSSGQLIEQAGLKGYRIGDAQISTKHANFIVNLGKATSTDVLRLIQYVQHTVLALFGVHLQPEVEVVGEDLVEIDSVSV